MNNTMTYVKAAKRALATFISGAVTSPLASISLNVGYWKVAAIAGATAVVNLVWRSAQAWLANNPGN